MNHSLLTTSRRRFLQALGLLATGPAVLARPTASHSISGEPDWLRAWNALPRKPIQESADRIVQQCLVAADKGTPLHLYYHGGTTPGRHRKFSPELVFRLPHRDTSFVSGYCHLRQAPRILRSDRISLA